VVEFAQVLALVCGLLARIGTEVYELARPEIGELAEPVDDESVSSITMPHKRNPERSEHLDTLARLVHAHAGVMLAGLTQQHERDGRGWKAEWVALPEVCLLTSTALEIATGLLAGLEVHRETMLENLRRHGGYGASEQILARLTPRMGKHRAQAQLQKALRRGLEGGQSLVDTLVAAGLLTETEARELDAAPDTGACAAMVDTVVERVRLARAQEPEVWP
jgi:adenylosuccinate lyase